MSFGLSAAAWIGIGTAVVGAAGTAATIDAQRSAGNKQRDAINAAQEADARQAAEAKTGAATSANAKLASDRRARQANVLALGAGTSDTLGAPGQSVLAGGAPKPMKAPATGIY